jgi:hypothetical protein
MSKKKYKISCMSLSEYTDEKLMTFYKARLQMIESGKNGFGEIATSQFMDHIKGQMPDIEEEVRERHLLQ